MAKTTRKQALLIARRLGCYGAHQNGDGEWMPCVDHGTWEALRDGKPVPSKKSAPMSVIEYRAKMLDSKSRNLFSNRDEALEQSKRNGCNRVRILVVNGSRMYAACMPKNNGRPENTGMIPPSKDFEKLGEQGVMGIDTLPGGGLVSAKGLGKRPYRDLFSLGTPTIRMSGKPSQVDGDNDGFVTGPTGIDNVPAPRVPKMPSVNNVPTTRGRRPKRRALNYDDRVLLGHDIGSNMPRRRTTQMPAEQSEGLGFYVDREDRTPGPPKPNAQDFVDLADAAETLDAEGLRWRRQADNLPRDVFSGRVSVSKEEAEKMRRDAEAWRLEAIRRRKKEREKKSLDITEIDGKGFVNFVSRSTDPDVFTNADSARVRARQLGCIGIRSYTANDGKTVYLPCTNTPDYNRRMNLRPDGRPKKKDDLDGKSLAKTPAPKKDRIIGSDKNRVGSAGSLASAGKISVDESIKNSLISKVREHNAEVKKRKKDNWSKTNLRALMAVYRRGAGAFSVSHRPGMTRNQWAMGRVNAFLRLLMSGSAKASYVTDNDLLPKGHPWKKKTIGTKTFFVDDVEYCADIIGTGLSHRYENPNVVNRYIVFPLDQDNLQIS